MAPRVDFDALTPEAQHQLAAKSSQARAYLASKHAAGRPKPAKPAAPKTSRATTVKAASKVPGVAGVAAKLASGAAKAPAATVGAVRSSGAGSRSASKIAAALFFGAITLEVLSYLTGQYFNFDWASFGAAPLDAGQGKTYLDLYQGQSSNLQTLAQTAAGQRPATMAQQSQAAQLLTHHTTLPGSQAA